MSYCPHRSPIGWTSSRFGHCYQSTLPTGERGMQATMHRNLSPRFRRKPPQNNNGGVGARNGHHDDGGGGADDMAARYERAQRILERQRVLPKTFTGSAIMGEEDAEVARRVTDRLFYIPEGEGRNGRPRTAPAPQDAIVDKPLYTGDEVAAILNKLCNNESGNRKERQGEDEEEGREETRSSQDGDNQECKTKKKNEIMKRFNKPHLYYPGDQVADALREFCKDTAEPIYGSNGRKSRLQSQRSSARTARDVKQESSREDPGDSGSLGGSEGRDGSTPSERPRRGGSGRGEPRRAGSSGGAAARESVPPGDPRRRPSATSSVDRQRVARRRASEAKINDIIDKLSYRKYERKAEPKHTRGNTNATTSKDLNNGKRP